ncbi:Rnase Y domain-containing protein, partial [uncultured Cyclobacterium sp.]
MGISIYIIISGAIGVLIGGLLAGLFIKNNSKKIEEEARERAKSLIREAEITAEGTKKDKILEAKEKYLKLKSDFEEEVGKKKNILITNENKLKQREQILSKEMEHVKRKEAELDSKKENLNAQLHAVQIRKDELDKVTHQRITDLEKVALLTREEAREQLIEMLKDEAATKASSHIK